jgi:hypothetical protein
MQKPSQYGKTKTTVDRPETIKTSARVPLSQRAAIQSCYKKMESHNLKTASSYINNLLLARGLLRNGKPIEFAHPSKGEGGKEATLASIINIVHDLILKRDVRYRFHP